MCPSQAERSFDAAVEALEDLVGTHYRPKGKDAAASFANLKTWADVRSRLLPCEALPLSHVELSA
jgi:hypothetical protein